MINSLENIYISTKEFSDWVKENEFSNKDLITLDELINKYEDALDVIECLNEKISVLELENREMNEHLCYKGTQSY